MFPMEYGGADSWNNTAEDDKSAIHVLNTAQDAQMEGSIVGVSQSKLGADREFNRAKHR